MAVYHLSTLGFAKPEQQALQAVLTLSERALSASWSFIPDSVNVDVVLVSLNSDEGLEFWTSPTRDNPSVYFVACSGDPDFDTPWKLRMSSSMLPSRRELIDLLNALSGHISSNPPVAASEGQEPGPSEPLAQPPEIPPESPPVAEETHSEAALQPTPPPPVLDATAVSAAPSPEIPAEPHPVTEEVHAEEVLQPAPPPPALDRAQSRPKPVGFSVFDPQHHFLGLVQQAIAASREALFVLPGNAWLAISPQAQNYYTTVSSGDLLPLLRADVDDIQVRDLSIEKMLESPMGKEAKAYPLVELVWHAALASSGGRLMAGCHVEDVVRLKHWPHVAHLPSYRQYLKLAAFMNHNAANLEDIAEQTGTPLGSLFDFHNACEAMGLLERHVQAELVKKPTEGLVKELYRKISSRLARPSHEDKAS